MSYRSWVRTLALAGVVLAPTMAAAQAAYQAPAKQAPQKVDDATLTSRVDARLKADATLKKDNIDVTVSEGVATLTGTVHSRTQSARAGRLAKIAGVSRVDNKLEVETAATAGVGEKTGKAVDKAAAKSEKTMKKAGAKSEKAMDKAADKTKSGASAVGETVTDAWIATALHAKFVDEATLKGSDINVDTTNHVVTLKGTVASAAGRNRAVAIAKATKGVSRVVDELTIAPKK